LVEIGYLYNMKLILTEEQFKILMTEGQECDVFQDLTGAEDYDDVLKQDPHRFLRTLEGSIVQMSPREYLERCAELQDTSIQDQFKYIDQLKVYEIARKMAKGEKYYLPYLNYNNKHQEGRHRVRAAELLGCQMVKVAVFKKPDQEEVSHFDSPEVTLAEMESKYPDVYTDPQGTYVVYKHDNELNGETSKFLDLYPDVEMGFYLLDCLMGVNWLESQTNEVDFSIDDFILDEDHPDLTNFIWEVVVGAVSEDDRKEDGIDEPSSTYEALQLPGNWQRAYEGLRPLGQYCKNMLNSCLIHDFVYWNSDFFDDGLENGYTVELVPKAGIMKVYSDLSYSDPGRGIKSGKEFLEYHDAVMNYERSELPRDHGHYKVRKKTIDEYITKFPPVS